MKAIVLAGGLGTRLHPLTINVPKPMAPVANRPLMEYTIELLVKHGIKDVTALLFHKPHIIKNHFGDGKKFGVKMSYVEATQDYGTAGAVKFAADNFKEPFIVISADLITDFDLKSAIENHKAKEAALTIVLTRASNPLPYGIVITNKDGKIKRFLEKPSWSEVFSDTINTGIYIVDPKVMEYIPKEKNFDFSHDLFPQLLDKKEKLFGYVMEGMWKDIGSLEEYGRVHSELLKDLSPIIDAKAKVSKNSRMEGYGMVGVNTFIADDAAITNSIVGANCQIGRGARIRDSIIWDNAIIGSNVSFERVIIGNNCNIDDRVRLEDEVVVSDDVRIGKDAVIKPRVKIWPSKVIEEGSVVSRTMVLRERYPKTIFGPFGVTGIVNVELTPEFVSNLGVAYGNFLGKGAHITASRDAHKASRMLYRAFISGVLSAGVNIFNLENVPIPVTRYDLRSSRSLGGFHVRKSPFDSEVIDIKFFDESGMDITSTKEKKIERLFFGEEFKKISVSDVGELTFPFHRVSEQYKEGILSQLNLDVIKRKSCRIVIDYAYGAASQLFPNILGELECDVVALNAHVDESKITKSKEEFERSLVRLSQIVKSVEADMGIMFDAGAEKLFLCDEKGRVYSSDKALVVVTHLLLGHEKKATIAVPINTSSVIDKIAKQFGSKLIRTKSTPRDMMEAALKDGVKFVGERTGGFIFPQFQPSFDAMFATCKLIEFLNQSDTTLSKIASEVPDSRVLRRDISCLPELKGKVIRTLSEELKDEEVDLVDGIRVNYGDSWILILPHPLRPVIELFAEAPKEKDAERLLHEYTKKIDDIIT
ncbi:mannose-1-phosphate guanyltransferase [Candidatus Saganbacteria bacterium]|nr:mannose-1-phosphate guanyltransferase [Candidatus Saganbacteria bacterium]